jgi:transposase
MCLFDRLLSWSDVSVRVMIIDAMWGRLEPLMPADPVRERRWADHRRTVEAVAWMYCTGSPWRDLPEGLGSFQTAHKRLLRWAMDGTWERILAAVLAVADGADEIGWTVVSRLHGLPGPPARRRSQEKGASGQAEPGDYALGRSRGGLGTKVHLASDNHARPLTLRVTAGQAGDAPAFEMIMADIRVPRSGPGRPGTRPDTVLSGRAYSS